MKKTLILILILAFSSQLFVIAQDLVDIEIQTIQLQKIELSSHGIIAHYVTSSGKGDGIYLPSSWFQFHLAKANETGNKIKARKRFPTKPISKYPFLKATYHNGKLDSIDLILSFIYDNELGIPEVEGELSQEMINRFQEQEVTDYLIMK